METGPATGAAEAVTEAAPEDYERLRSLLLSRREAMPKRLKQLAAFAVEHPEEVAFGTVAGIAEHAGVQPSTLVRFAQTLGYDGFSHLQQVFRARLRERFPDYTERLRILRDSEPPGGRMEFLLDGFVQAGSLSLDRLRDSINPRDLTPAVDMLARAGTNYLL